MSKPVREVSKKKVPVAAPPQSGAREREPSFSLLSAGLIARVEGEREQLFKAIAIVELCRLSTATLLETNDSECMVPALEATCDLLNASAERLEWISSDLQKLSRSTLPLTKEKRAELDRRLDAYEADRKPGRAAAGVISSIRKRL